MTEVERFLSWLYDYGNEASWVSVTGGTACPCMVNRGSDVYEYSQEWHRNNPASEMCDGTGLIGRTLTTTTIKAIIHPPGVQFNSIYTPKESLTPIGELQIDDMLLWGSVNVSTGAFVDLSSMDEAKDYIVFQSKNYITWDWSDYFRAGVRIGQVCLLRRVKIGEVGVLKTRYI